MRAKIGDDALQRSNGGAVVPESFTHGSSAQRQRWFSMNVTPLDARRQGAVVSHSDITERVQAEARLRASQMFLDKTGRIGGITPWLKVAHLAESFNVPICPHFLMELHVSLCAAVPNAPWVEYIPQLDSITTSGMARDEGFAIPSDSRGLGIAWDWSAVETLAMRKATLKN